MNEMNRIGLVITLLSLFTLSFLFSIEQAAAHPPAIDSKPDTAAAVIGRKSSISSLIKKIYKVVSKKGITKIPTVSSSLKLNSLSSSSVLAAALQADSFDVSGTPPPLSSIPLQTIKNLFWRPGVIDSIAVGNPSQQQCSEFLAGPIDGLSGGLGACHMAEGVGHGFQTLLSSETSVCYMKQFPTKANVAAGAITLMKGSYPHNDVTKLFAPGKSSRLIKVNFTPPPDHPEEAGESIFIQVPSIRENKKGKFFYQANLYFCREGASAARGFNLVQITNKGQMKIIGGEASSPRLEGSHSITVSGSLTYKQGSPTWDLTKNRQSMVDVVNGDATFKTEFVVTPDNYIVQKRRENFEDRINKNYSITRFSGDDARSVSFLEGAYKGESQFENGSHSFQGAAEYRDVLYAAAPSNALVENVSGITFQDDPFYDQLPVITVDVTPYSCTAEPDIELLMDGRNETLKNALQTCFDNRLENMEFCRNDGAVRLAQARFGQLCKMPPG